MKLILTRHGQTIANYKRIIQGQLNSELSKKGIQQAKRIAERLKDETIDAAFTSDLGRAVRTAEEILLYHQNTPLFQTKKIRERSFGEIEGKLRSSFEGQDYHSFDCCETRQSLMDRTKSFLDELSIYQNKTILIVGHGAINIALVANVLGESFQYSLDLGHMSNTGVTLFNPYPSLELFNCKKHLEDMKD